MQIKASTFSRSPPLFSGHQHKLPNYPGSTMATDSNQHQLSASGNTQYGLGRQSSSHPYHKTNARIVSGYFNLLLIFVPLGICSAALKFPPVAVFCLNLLAITPLTAWITFAIGQLSFHIVRIADELLKATLGNPIEVLIGLVALSQGQTLNVQRIVIGNIVLFSLLVILHTLSSDFHLYLAEPLLLQVLGCCLFVVGSQQKRVEFDRTTTSITSSLTIIVAISLIVPTTMSAFPPTDENGTVVRDYASILHVSHAAAIILLILCILFFYFQFHTHPSLFRVTSTQQLPAFDYTDVGCRGNLHRQAFLSLNRWVAAVVLVAATTALVSCIVFLLRTVDEVERTVGISSAFLVTVLVPLIGNVSKITTVVAVARRNPVDLAIRAIMATNLRLLILIMPALVIIGWILDQPLTLQFDLFDASILFLAIMVMNYLIQDGRSNYFEGLVLMGTYIIIAVAFEVRPIPPEGVIIL
ncbi:hypothetical protein BGW36DRAFT_377444 [Talaromyces proteolyticus]|uniref:Sodium/calcium exchanger membrane region domain-containing protein n=1 Tax=Talaromyces proteolyticus TaxID=1131652 RepID=A0AAD4KTX2_9EURO|nr:uncharacterized protein BGW36DRAFT_377444 [Talaromyces proteolyticus]KAH8699197.1 hypothetical protein BGW36DRAFT_377444 [Talaromyces proteolyticus]